MIPILLWLATATDPEARPLPLVPLVDFTGTEARALDDYLGQPLLLDFFAHWCAPCARLVPHLNEIAEAYGEGGLNVLAVTSDAAETAKEWLARLEARYPHARDAELRLQIELGFRPLPFAVLVDPFGVIVWQGNPADLPLETVEALLKSALSEPAHRWTAAVEPVREALRGREYAQAERAARALSEGNEPFVRFVGNLVARRIELLEAALAREDWLAADELAVELEAGLAEGAPRARAAAARARIASDEAARVVLAAQLRLRELWSVVGSLASVQQVDELAARIRTLREAHPGTQVERTAAMQLETLTALRSVLR